MGEGMHATKLDSALPPSHAFSSLLGNASISGGQPSDFAPVAGASLSRLLEGQPVKKVSLHSLHLHLCPLHARGSTQSCGGQGGPFICL